MTTVESIRNQYRGINAPCTAIGKAWAGGIAFMAIAFQICCTCTTLLPMGYTANLESSLQLRRFDDKIDNKNRILPSSKCHLYAFLPTTQPVAAPGVFVLPVLMPCKNHLSVTRSSWRLPFTSLSGKAIGERWWRIWIELSRRQIKAAVSRGRLYGEKR